MYDGISLSLLLIETDSLMIVYPTRQHPQKCQALLECSLVATQKRGCFLRSKTIGAGDAREVF